MKERYVKIVLSPRDKLNFLLFDLIPEKFLYQNNKIIEQPVITKEVIIQDNNVQDNINIKEDTLMFFDLIDTDVKSNL